MIIKTVHFDIICCFLNTCNISYLKNAALVEKVVLGRVSTIKLSISLSSKLGASFSKHGVCHDDSINYRCDEIQTQGPLTRLQREPLISDSGTHHRSCGAHLRHARAVIHIGIAYSRWRGQRYRHSRRMRNPQFYKSGKMPMQMLSTLQHIFLHHWFIHSYFALNYNKKYGINIGSYKIHI